MFFCELCKILENIFFTDYVRMSATTFYSPWVVPRIILNHVKREGIHVIWLWNVNSVLYHSFSKSSLDYFVYFSHCFYAKTL